MVKMSVPNISKKNDVGSENISQKITDNKTFAATIQ